MLGRIEATSPTASEWLTRLLYYQDSLSIMKDYPFGTGHLGFYYLQRIYQTGATYYVKYSHSQIIQIVLDIGIVGAGLVGIYFLMTIFSRRLIFHEKLAIIIIFGHGAIDFDWEFVAVLMVLIIIVNVDADKIDKISFPRRWGYALAISAMMVYSYMGISAYWDYVGREELAVDLYPYNTEAKASLARKYEGSNNKRAYNLAEEIIKQNPYNLTGYRIMRDIQYGHNQLEEALVSARKVVELNPLSIHHLEIYSDILLSYANEQLASGHREDVDGTIKELLEIPYYLDRLAKERLTSYNVKHKPKLFMSKKLRLNQQEVEQLLDTILVVKRD